MKEYEKKGYSEVKDDKKVYSDKEIVETTILGTPEEKYNMKTTMEEKELDNISKVALKEVEEIFNLK